MKTGRWIMSRNIIFLHNKVRDVREIIHDLIGATAVKMICKTQEIHGKPWPTSPSSTELGAQYHSS
jgi:hypothetical protein